MSQVKIMHLRTLVEWIIVIEVMPSIIINPPSPTAAAAAKWILDDTR